MKRRFDTLAQKTYKVFRTPWRLGQPQGIERARAFLLEFPKSSSAPNVRDDGLRTPVPPLPSDAGIDDPNISLPQAEDYVESSKAISEPSATPIASVDLPYSSDVEMGNQEELPRYTSGPSRIINSPDGLVLVLTKEMIAELSEIIHSSRKFEHLETECNKAEREVNVTRRFMENSDFLIESSNNEDEKIRIRQEMEEQEPTYLRNIKRRDELENELRFLRTHLRYLQSLSQEKIENALDEANLLNVPEIVLEEDPASSQPQNPVPDSVEPAMIDEVPMTSDESYNRAVQEEVERTRQNLFQAQAAFDATRDANEEDKLKYDEAKGTDMYPYSELEVDLFFFQRGSDNTRALIVAEQEHKEAKARARALGLLENQWDQESDFVNDPDDGYRESQEADMKAAPDVEYLRNWTNDAIGCQNPFTLQPEEMEPDNWETKTVAMSDTLSCVDLDLDHRRRIDQWGERMDYEREECKILKEKTSLKRRDSAYLLESCKRVKTEESYQSMLVRRNSCSELRGEASDRWRLVAYSPQTLQCIFFPNPAIGQ